MTSWTSLRPRSIAAGLGVLAAATLLTACDKPSPTITVLHGDGSDQVKAQPACAVFGSCHYTQSDVRRINAAGGSQILLDVPKNLADSGWVAAAYTTDAAGTKNTALNTPGASSQPIRGKHTVTLQVPDATTGSYLIQVTALKPSNQLTTWLIGVTLTQ